MDTQEQLTRAEIAFEGKKLLELGAKYPEKSTKDLFRMIEKMKKNNKEICELTDKLIFE